MLSWTGHYLLIKVGVIVYHSINLLFTAQVIKLFGILVQELKEKKRVCQELLIYKFVYLESTLFAKFTI